VSAPMTCAARSSAGSLTAPSTRAHRCQQRKRAKDPARSFARSSWAAVRGAHRTATAAPTGTISNSASTRAFSMRMQPSLAACPMLAGSLVP